MVDEIVIEESSSEPAAAKPAQKMFTQDEVSYLIGKKKEEAAEKARRQLEAEYAQKMQAQANLQNSPDSGETKEIDADAVYQQVQERLAKDMQQKQLEQHMSDVASAYHQKMEAGAGAYDDFNDTVKSFDAAAFPQVVYLVSGMDNAADIVYELAKNPSKLTSVDLLSQKAPEMARLELLKIGKSIDANKAALLQQAQAGDIPEPLDRMQSSSVANNGGQTSIEDLRSQPWLKG